MAGRSSSSKKKPQGDSGAAAARKGREPDGYEGANWELYWRVRPHHRHSGATGAGLVEYTLWTEVVQQRGGADRPEVDLPGQPVR